MIDIGKYKILWYLLSLTGTCYGSYEIYNNFIKQHTSSKKSGKQVGEVLQTAPENPDANIDEPKEAEAEQIKEDDNGEKEEQRDDDSPEEEKESEPEKAPEVQEQIPAQDDTPPKPISYRSNTNPRREYRTSTEFIDSNGSIIIHEGKIGSKFKDYLITSTTDNEVWTKKLNAWNQDLDYYKNKHRGSGKNISTMPNEFLLKSFQQSENKELQRRCYNAYKKEKWTDLSTSVNRALYNPTTRVREYWAMVWKYCGQPLKETPSGWYSG